MEHDGCEQKSDEECDAIVMIVEELLGREVVDSKGVQRRMQPEDILIVAPFNLQVRCLREKLPAAIRIGSVDKFQGQEAPVSIYSMATSSPADAPRGMEFLYSLNRLNVATSRARCLAAIVSSPGLLRVRCRTPRQMQLANGFCRLLELAEGR